MHLWKVIAIINGSFVCLCQTSAMYFCIYSQSVSLLIWWTHILIGTDRIFAIEDHHFCLCYLLERFLLHFAGKRKVLIEAHNRRQGGFDAPPPPIEDLELGLKFQHLRISPPFNSIHFQADLIKSFLHFWRVGTKHAVLPLPSNSLSNSFDILTIICFNSWPKYSQNLL